MAVNKRYKEEWGNYKSDTYKSKRILQCEISDLLCHAELTRKDLIEIRNLFLKLDKS